MNLLFLQKINDLADLKKQFCVFCFEFEHGYLDEE